MRIARSIACVVIAALFAFIGTFMLLPVWSWIEATFGIESIGHSGPAEWCFLLTYGFALAIALVIAFRKRQ